MIEEKYTPEDIKEVKELPYFLDENRNIVATKTTEKLQRLAFNYLKEVVIEILSEEKIKELHDNKIIKFMDRYEKKYEERYRT